MIRIRTNLSANLIWTCSYRPRKPLRWRTRALGVRDISSSLREGRDAVRSVGDGFMGQFAFTRALAQITPVLIRLSKWGAAPYCPLHTAVQAFVYIRSYFSPAICFDGPFLKHECLEARNWFTTDTTAVSTFDFWWPFFYVHWHPYLCVNVVQ